MRFFPFVLKNLFRKKTRSLLTIGSILLPLFVISILGTLLATLNSDPTGGHGMYRLITRHKVSITSWLPRAYEEKIRQVPGVKEIIVSNWFGGQYKDARPENQFARFAVTPGEKLMSVFDEAKIVKGSEKDWVEDRSGALVGELLMKKYGWKIGDKLPLKGDIYPINMELNIRASFQAPDETAIYFHYEAIEEALPRVKGFAGWYWMKADSVEAVARIPKTVDAMFENSSSPTKTETEKEMQNGFISMLGNVKFLVTSISGVIVFVILLIAANTMAMSARERVTEIAVLRTLGFQKKTILGLVLGESLLLSAFGGLLGTTLFVVLFPGFRQGLLMSPMGGFAAGMKLFPSVVLTAFFVTIFVGLVAGIVPAIRSAMRPITDGLRQVG